MQRPRSAIMRHGRKDRVAIHVARWRVVDCGLHHSASHPGSLNLQEVAMKRTIALLACLAVLSLVVAPIAAAAGTAGSWNGWITDEKCGAKDANAGAAACVAKCNDKGAKLVLYNGADKKLYKLDKQDVAKQ